VQAPASRGQTPGAERIVCATGLAAQPKPSRARKQAVAATPKSVRARTEASQPRNPAKADHQSSQPPQTDSNQKGYQNQKGIKSSRDPKNKKATQTGRPQAILRRIPRISGQQCDQTHEHADYFQRPLIERVAATACLRARLGLAYARGFGLRVRYRFDVSAGVCFGVSRSNFSCARVAGVARYAPTLICSGSTGQIVGLFRVDLSDGRFVHGRPIYARPIHARPMHARGISLTGG
jgi:hypothetical protein